MISVPRKSSLPPEGLLYQLEMAFARVMNYPRNKQYQADLIRLEKEMLKRLGGDYAVFDQLGNTQPPAGKS